MKRLTQEGFITRAKKAHGNIYDYSKVEYMNSATKVKIICPKHGEFEQTPNSHLRGCGCPLCSNNNKKDTKTIIKEFNDIHGNKYDYSKVDYKNANRKVKIICPIHGEFEQRPNNHLRGEGCKECGYKSIGDKNGFTLNTFIKRSRKIHGNIYDYSKVEYMNSATKVKIICPKHGEFEQIPHSHMKGFGCRECSSEKLSREMSKSLSQFTKESIEVHGDKYNYNLIKYKNTNRKVKIICPIHGVFEQKPYKHLQGQGCPICKQSKMERLVRNNLISEGIEFIQQYSKKDGAEWLGRLSLDFYLPKHSIGIECQGLQHFEPVSFGNGDEKYINDEYLRIVKRDLLKNTICVDNDVKIMYFSNHTKEKYISKIYNDIMVLIKNIKINVK